MLIERSGPSTGERAGAAFIERDGAIRIRSPIKRPGSNLFQKDQCGFGRGIQVVVAKKF
jgi:hypothetical protein